jgi:hypothetical protein
MPAPTSSSRGAPARLARPGSGPTFRPNLQMLSELRLDLDPAWRPHSFYSVGMKAYGRAPTFLITTGNAGVRSIAAAPGRGPRCRRVVQLVLPRRCLLGAHSAQRQRRGRRRARGGTNPTTETAALRTRTTGRCRTALRRRASPPASPGATGPLSTRPSHSPQQRSRRRPRRAPAANDGQPGYGRHLGSLYRRGRPLPASRSTAGRSHAPAVPPRCPTSAVRRVRRAAGGDAGPARILHSDLHRCVQPLPWRWPASPPSRSGDDRSAGTRPDSS